ncbi:MAG: hypothetical protein AAGI13_02175 [Pseudomonadota bacterium]
MPTDKGKLKATIKLFKAAKAQAGKAKGKLGKTIDKLAMLGASTAQKQNKANQNRSGFLSYVEIGFKNYEDGLDSLTQQIQAGNLKAAAKTMKSLEKTASKLQINARKMKRYSDEFDRLEAELDKISTATHKAMAVNAEAADPKGKHAASLRENDYA